MLIHRKPISRADSRLVEAIRRAIPFLVLFFSSALAASDDQKGSSQIDVLIERIGNDPSFLFWGSIAIILAAIIVFQILGGLKRDGYIRRIAIVILSLFILGVFHSAFANFFFGHDWIGGVLVVAILSFLEHLYHNLRSIPNAVKEELKKIAIEVSVPPDKLDEIKSSLVQAIPGALSSKQIFVTGTLHGAQLREMVQVIDSHKKLAACENGIGIFWFGANADDYSALCTHFLEKTQQQVEGMSDMEFDKALLLFSGDAKPVEWINQVNAKAQTNHQPIRSRRVLVMTEERRLFLAALEAYRDSTTDAMKANARNTIRDYSRLSSSIMGNGSGEQHLVAFIAQAVQGLDKFYKDYCQVPVRFNTTMEFNILVRQSSEIGGGYVFRDSSNWKHHEGLPRGEFIIFDRKYLVRFNADQKLLEVFIGELVSKFAEVFDADLLKFPTGATFAKLDLGLKAQTDAI